VGEDLYTVKVLYKRRQRREGDEKRGRRRGQEEETREAGGSFLI
jgi:hypothetical protein